MYITPYFSTIIYLWFLIIRFILLYFLSVSLCCILSCCNKWIFTTCVEVRPYLQLPVWWTWCRGCRERWRSSRCNPRPTGCGATVPGCRTAARMAAWPRLFHQSWTKQRDGSQMLQGMVKVEEWRSHRRFSWKYIGLFLLLSLKDEMLQKLTWSWTCPSKLWSRSL